MKAERSKSIEEGRVTRQQMRVPSRDGQGGQRKKGEDGDLVCVCACLYTNACLSCGRDIKRGRKENQGEEDR